ncbi:UNVERIFIED_CONTAM: hypothetical protein GTU68_033894 [Idotea baltica]|nr:hypothetical protein [Idotea baltica]
MLRTARFISLAIKTSIVECPNSLYASCSIKHTYKDRLRPTRCIHHSNSFEDGGIRHASTEIHPNMPELRPLYLDAQSTTPLDPRVLDKMLPYLTSFYGNPHSRTHAYGWESEAAMERAREQVSSLIGADKREIVFTSGATESNNISIKGVARFYKSKKRHIITTQTEHKCVLDSCRVLENEGWDITYLPVGKNGIVCLKELESAIRPDTVLVSVMMVNNEIGVIQPTKEIGALCRERKVFFHTDAAQAVGKLKSMSMNRILT